MRKNVIMVITALVMSAAVPALSQQTNQEKVICELESKNCLNQVDIIQRKIKKLNAEIKKGTKTYSAEDLKKLEQKLQETKDLLDKMQGAAK